MAVKYVFVTGGVVSGLGIKKYWILKFFVIYILIFFHIIFLEVGSKAPLFC